MRIAFAAAILLAAVVAVADDAPKAVSIALEPLGDRDGAVVAQVFFRFANPRAITDAGLFLEGSFTQAGQVPRNFRIAVPRKNDRMVWNNSFARNGRTIRRTRWAVLPDQRNEMAMVHTFAEGTAEIEVRLVLEGDYGQPSQLIAEAAETFTLVKTNRPFAEDVEEAAAEDVAEEEAGPVKIRAPHRNDTGLYLVEVEVLPPVQRVEFLVGGKRVLARNAPPYSAELDLGDSPGGVTIRAVGYDAAGRQVAADEVVVAATRRGEDTDA